MKTNMYSTRLRTFTSTRLSILALAGLLLPNAIHAGTCDTMVADMVTWLKQNPLNNITATVAANRPPSWALQAGQSPTGASEVTYTNVDLRPAGGYVQGGLYAPVNGQLLYDDRQWYPPNSFVGHPFDPFHTDSFGLIISATGTAYVYPANTVATFAATCNPGGNVMYGQPAPPSPFNPALPFYTITFTRWVSQPPPK